MVYLTLARYPPLHTPPTPPPPSIHPLPHPISVHAAGHVSIIDEPCVFGILPPLRVCPHPIRCWCFSCFWSLQVRPSIRNNSIPRSVGRIFSFIKTEMEFSYVLTHIYQMFHTMPPPSPPLGEHTNSFLPFLLTVSCIKYNQCAPYLTFSMV